LKREKVWLFCTEGGYVRGKRGSLKSEEKVTSPSSPCPPIFLSDFLLFQKTKEIVQCPEITFLGKSLA